MDLDAYRYDTWDGIPVYDNPRLSLNVVSRHSDRIEMSFTTWLQLKSNPTMRRHAKWAAAEVGVHSIPAMMDIPTGKVGNLFRESQTVLAMAAEGLDYKDRSSNLRAEVEALQAVLAETLAALDLADQVADINMAAAT